MARSLAPQIAAVRSFNRFYTRKIGVLREGLLDSGFSLTEARVLYELGRREEAVASDIAAELDLDAGYLSRIVHGFVRRGLIARRRSAADRRRALLGLTARGRKIFATLDARSNAESRALLSPLSALERERLVAAIRTIESVLGASPAPREPYLLRTHQPGDLGWIVSRHGALYAQEYGWDERIEALAAEVVANFIRHFDSRHERCWLAERDGTIVGGVLIAKHTPRVARLRLLFVEPEARGLGIERRLVAECIRFARQAGYRKLVLWTNDPLIAARRLYEAVGFRLVAEKPHHEFGVAMKGQSWELALPAR